MALWQIDFFILPKRYSTDEISNHYILDDMEFDDSYFWQESRISPSIFNSIKEFMPITKSWNKQLIIYGDENSNRLSIIVENTIVISASFRIDFTSNYEYVLHNIITFCIKNGFSILDNNLNILYLNFESINSAIQNSPQVIKYNKLLGTNKN